MREPMIVVAVVAVLSAVGPPAAEGMIVSDGTVSLSTSDSAGEYTGDGGFVRVGETAEFVAQYTDDGQHIAGATCQIVFIFQEAPFDGTNWVAGPTETMTEDGDRYVYSRSFDEAECVYYEVTAGKDGYPTLTTTPDPDTQVGDYVVVFEPATYYRELSAADRERLVLPDEDLVYEGAMKFSGASGESRWGYGPQALTYCPEGDPDGPSDGYPGSIFGSGHPWHNCVSEMSIAQPVISPAKNYADLNTGATLQPFADITGGLMDSGIGPWEYLDNFGGLAWLPTMGAQTSPKLYWCFFYYYNVSNQNLAGHGWSETNLSDPQAKAAWHIGPFGDGNYSSKRTNEYIFEIPEDWADTYVGGKRLACGKGDGCGSAGVSHGPAIYAYAPWQDGNPPPDGTELDTVILLMYPPSGNYMQPAWTNGDAHRGGEWLTTATGKSAVVFSLTKGLGRMFYGIPRDGDPGGGKGYHFTPYETRIYFYDPAELAEVAQGTKQYYEVVPYAVFRPGEYFWPSAGGSINDMAFDRQNGLLYVSQPLGENPLLHVFRVAPALPDTTPPTVNVESVVLKGTAVDDSGPVLEVTVGGSTVGVDGGDWTGEDVPVGVISVTATDVSGNTASVEVNVGTD